MLDHIKVALGLDALRRVDHLDLEYAFEWMIGGRRYLYGVPKITRPVKLYIGPFFWKTVERADEHKMWDNLIAAIRSTLAQ